jgi:hypothetical protein
MITTTEPRFGTDTPRGRWSVTVPIAEEEQRQEADNGYSRSHSGKPFTADTLRIAAVYQGAIYQVTGPNIRADGSAGKFTYRRKVSRDYAESTYPAAMAVAVETAGKLAAQIRADAEQACADIAQATS